MSNKSNLSNLSTNNSILDQWSRSKGSNQPSSGHLSLTSSLLKTSLKIDSAKPQATFPTALTLSAKSSPLNLPPSSSSLASSLKGCSLLQPSKLTNPLLKTSKEEPSGSGLFCQPTLNTSLSRLSLKTNVAKDVVSGKEKQKDFPHKSGVTRSASPGKSVIRKRKNQASTVTSKKKIVEDSSNVPTAQIIKKYTIKPPHYSFQSDRDFGKEVLKQPNFSLPLSDVHLTQSVGKVSDNIALKRGFINCVSGSLIAQPNLTNKEDLTRQQLLRHVQTIQEFDPEFILKVALYSRKELGIRTTSNFLLALAANFDSTRQHLKKYFCACTALPSDWIEVAQIFQTFDDNNLKIGSLPAALRKTMTTKFSEFDEYQLAKYNKESSGKKKKSKEKKAKAAMKTGKNIVSTTGSKEKASKRRNFFDSDSSDSDDEKDVNEKAPFRQLSSVSYDDKTNEEALRNQRFTIKQLIRKLHIKEPVQYVMSIIGKKYPSTSEEFYQKRLPGTFDETKAGKRMKLAVPETWETQVSLKGNTAKTWEDLIDHKKLPFMAMLRNLRNLIKAGISLKHHNSILRRLCDQRSVVNSKQFPFRFFSAYVALNDLEEAYEKNQREIIETAVAREQNQTGVAMRGRGGLSRGTRGSAGGFGVRRGGVQKMARGGNRRGVGRGDKNQAEWWIRKKMKKEGKNGNEIREVPYDKNLIQRYRKALDTAVKIATVHNVYPIKGRTILLCDIGHSMDRPCSSAKGLGKPRTMKEISVLMGLMCKYSCEECEFIVFDESGCREVQLQPGTILDNMDVVLQSDLQDSQNEMVQGVPYSVLLEKLRDKIEVDNLLIFGEDFYPEMEKGIIVNDFLRNYRHMVNPNLLFVSVTFSSPRTGFAPNVDPRHHNDIYISGYSDALLRFIAERGDSGQINHVEKIDVAFQLCSMPNKTFTRQRRADVKAPLEMSKTLQLTAPTPSWRTVRVFISSTFRDMHGERDLLTRFIFPELRSLVSKKFINVYEVDLRWGITEEQSKDNRALEICLQEVGRCQLFVGLLGERYGWTPDTSQVPSTSEFDWVSSYMPGASVTELEMQLGALSKAAYSRDTAFFFMRDNSFEKDVPASFLSDFTAESDGHKSKLAALKQRIRDSGLEVFDRYPCHWGGFVSGKPIVAGLDEFGARILNTLENAVEKLYPEEDKLTEEEHINNVQWAFVEGLSNDFVGRQSLVKDINSKILSTQSGIICVSGKMGSGKTALLASTLLQYTKLKQVGGSYGVLLNFAGSAPGSAHLAATLRRLTQQLNVRFGLGHVLPEDFKNLILTLKVLLEEAAALCPSRLVMFLDGIDVMDDSHQPTSLDWLPSPLPDNVIVVITALEGGQTHKSCKRLQAHEIAVAGLQNWDKAELVRTTLAKHRKSLNESGFGNQMHFLMLKKEASNPLYLKLACEELRVFGLFEKVSDKLKEMPHTTSNMLQEVLARLESEHGVESVTCALCLLTCARDGLYPEELHELMTWSRMLVSSNLEPKDIIYRGLDITQSMTPLNFTYLIRSISCFLNPSLSWSPLMTLSNREVHLAVKFRYMKGSNTSLESDVHKLLAAFFRNQADPLKDASWKSKNARNFVELPYHLAESGQLKELEEILCDHHFIQTKCQLGVAGKLMEDFVPKVPTSKSLQQKKLTSFYSSQRFQEYKSFVSRNIQVLSSYPALEWQQAINEPSSSLPYKDAASILSGDNEEASYMEWLNKPQDVSECYLTLSNVEKPAVSVCVSPCSTLFATGSQDMLVRLYSMDTGKELASFTGHSNVITDVCFVGSSMLCSASADCSLSVWDVDNRHRIYNLKGHNRRVNSCTSDRQGKLVASGSWDCTVIVWNVAGSGNKMATFDVGSPVNCVDFHPFLEQVVVGSWDSLIRIYNYFHKTRIAVFRGHSTSVRDLSYSFDGQHLASASMDGDIKIWAADKGSQVSNIRGHSGPINKLTFSPNGRELITAGEDRQIKVWSGDLGIPVHRIHEEKYGAATSIAIAPSGLTVAVGFHLGHVLLYDANTGAKIFTVKLGSFAVRAITFSTDNKYILAGCDNAITEVLQSNQGSKVCSLIGQTGSVLSVACSKSYVAVGGEDFSCCLYENIGQLKSFKQSNPSRILRGHVGPVTACCFNADETMLATSSRDASVRIYTLRDVFITDNAQPTQVIENCHEDWINSCQWSNTGPYLVTASNDFNLKVFDTKTATQKLLLTGHNSAINSVAYKFGCIVSGSSDGSLKVWSHKGTPITTLYGHTLRINACDIFVKCKSKTRDHEVVEQSWADITDKDDSEKQVSHQRDVNVQDVIVASAGDDGDVWLWKPLQANTMATLMGHSDRLLSVAVDENRSIVSCSLDCSTRVWHPRLSSKASQDKSRDAAVKESNGKHDAPVTFVIVSSDGEVAVSGSRDGMIKIWTKGADGIYDSSQSFQVHEKSVNCGSFHKHVSNQFITGGDDNCVHAWEIITRKNGFFIRKQYSIEMDMPIACVLTLSANIVCFTTWKGDVYLGGPSFVKQKIYSLVDSLDAKNWICAMACSKSSNQEIVFGTTNSVIGCIQMPVDESSGQRVGTEIQVGTDHPVNKEEIGSTGVSEDKKPPKWVSALTALQDITFAGDSLGQLLALQRQKGITRVLSKKKIHKASVTALEVVEKTVITGSSDGTIKVWIYSLSDSLHLEQVGQFFCPSPVTSLKVTEVTLGSRRQSKLNILVGDFLGNIHQLKWHA